MGNFYFNNNLQKNIKNPIDVGKQNIEEILADNCSCISQMHMMDSVSIPIFPDKYVLPSKKKFFFNNDKQIFLANVQKNNIKITVAADFTIVDVKECILIYNDKSNRKNDKSYILSLKNDLNYIENDILIFENAKSDFKQFQKTLDNCFNSFFINMKDEEFKTFMHEFVFSRISSRVTVYTNPGVIEEKNLLYENALVTSNGIQYAEQNGYIKCDERNYIKVQSGKNYIPKLAKSLRLGPVIANELLNNLIECWGNNILLALFVLGHMMMSIYFEKFTKNIGVPTMIIYGDTASGKSTLVNLGLAIFGFSDSSLISGGSTAKSNEYLVSKYNGMIVCVDDVKGGTLTSSNFTSLIKEVYNGQQRTKMTKFGKEIEYINTCSPLIYSTNEYLPNLQEVINRLSIVQIFGKNFDTNKFKYFSDNKDKIEELSLILPEMLKFQLDYVMHAYNDISDLIKNNTNIKEHRIINNLAYAYTGTKLLLQIGNVKIDNLDSMFLLYAEKQGAEYAETKNIVDRVIDDIFFLKNKENVLSFYKYQYVNGEKWLCFHKKSIIDEINKYYSYDKSRKIDEDQFTRYAKHHKRFRCEKTVDYYSNKVYSMCFDVTDIDEYSDFTPPASDTFNRF